MSVLKSGDFEIRTRESPPGLWWAELHSRYGGHVIGLDRESETEAGALRRLADALMGLGNDAAYLAVEVSNEAEGMT
jgi:hypothetical protein